MAVSIWLLTSLLAAFACADPRVLRRHLSRPVVRLDGTISGANNNTVQLIPLRRTAHDLQHSSNHLRRRYSEAALSPEEAFENHVYQAGAALLRATGASFLAPITFGSQSFLAVVDTGSSDTWVIGSGFTCVDIVTNRTIPEQRCLFGPQYTPGPEFSQIPDANFNITYGDGEFLTGVFGNSPVSFAGVTVPQQQVAVPSLAAWQGDSLTSGIIGLAYPGLTASYPGTDPHLDRYCAPGLPRSQCNQVEYSSLITSMISQNLIMPVFALALSRDESRSGDGGYLTIGGVPDLATVGVTQDKFTRTPIRVLPGDDRFRYYVIDIDGVMMLPAGSAMPADNTTSQRFQATFIDANGLVSKVDSLHAAKVAARRANQLKARQEKAPPPTAYQDYIVDSGTTLSFLPSVVVQQYAGMFNPPAAFDYGSGFYFVSCQTQVPPIAVVVGGTAFWHHPRDLLRLYDPTRQTCILGIQDNRRLGGINILGDVFLNSVLAVFDIGNKEIRFASRRDYAS